MSTDQEISFKMETKPQEPSLQMGETKSQEPESQEPALQMGETKSQEPALQMGETKSQEPIPEILEAISLIYPTSDPIIAQASQIFSYSYIELLSYLNKDDSPIDEEKGEAIDFVLTQSKVNKEKTFILSFNGKMPKELKLLEDSLHWISKFSGYENIRSTKQLGEGTLFLDWRTPLGIKAAEQQSVTIDIDTESATLNELYNLCHDTIVEGKSGWEARLDALVTAIKQHHGIFYTIINQTIVDMLLKKNEKIAFDNLKNKLSTAIIVRLQQLIDNVSEYISHLVDDTGLMLAELNSSRIKSMIAAIDMIVAFVRATSRILADTPLSLLHLHLNQMLRGREFCDQFSLLCHIVGVEDIYHMSHQTNSRFSLNHTDYSGRTLGTEAWEALYSKSVTEQEPLANVVNGQEEHQRYNIAQLAVDINHARGAPSDKDNVLESDFYELDLDTTSIADSFGVKIVVPVDSSSEDIATSQVGERLNQIDTALMNVLLMVIRMQKLVNHAEETLTPDSEATHATANADHLEHFAPIIDNTVSRLTSLKEIFEGFTQPPQSAITKATLETVNKILKKNNNKKKNKKLSS